MLSAAQVPFTGPLYGPSDPRGPNKSPTAIALKRAMIRLGHFDGDLGALDGHYNAKLELAVKQFQRTLPDVQRTGQYGRGTWEELRSARVPKGRPNAGQYALDAASQKLIREEASVPELGSAVRIRATIADFCERAERVEERWHYTQARPFTGLGVAPEREHRNDCSSYVILAYHWAAKTLDLAVPDPSGYDYKGWGNTWNDLDAHAKVSGRYLIGDLAHYDGHVTICRRAGDFRSAIWSSFGQEAGPQPWPLHYRDDFLFVVRPPLLVEPV